MSAWSKVPTHVSLTEWFERPRGPLVNQTLRSLAWWTCALGLLAGGVLLPDHPRYALLAAGGILFVGFTLMRPMTLPLISMFAIVVVTRVGGGSANLTLSDFVLFGAFWVAMAFSPRPFSKPMRTMLWLSLLYQVLSLFTVLVNTYTANTVEWFHAWLLVGGAMVVGWAVGSSGYARLGLTLLLVSSTLIAVLTCIDGFRSFASTGSFGPVYLSWPFNMHKNLNGCILGFAALLAYVRPVWVRWSPLFAMSTFAICAVGLLATQSRQAIIGLGVSLVIVAFRKDPDRKRSRLVVLAAVPIAVFVAVKVQDQLQSDNTFNSAFQRLTWYQQALTVWNDDQMFGAGLRWWTSGRTPYAFQPPNAELEVLTSVGTVGLIGFLTLMLGGVVVLWRVNPRYGTLAVTALISRIVQSQFDLFWVSIQVSIPFVIVGVCLGAQAYAEQGNHASSPLHLRSFRPLPTRTMAKHSKVAT